MKSKMKQVIVNKDSLVGHEELHIILLKKASKEEQTDAELIKKQIELYELYKNLNPRYSDEVIPIKEAREIPHTSDIVFSSKYNAFRVY
jgi:hypothetical protein